MSPPPPSSPCRFFKKMQCLRDGDARIDRLNLCDWGSGARIANVTEAVNMALPYMVFDKMKQRCNTLQHTATHCNMLYPTKLNVNEAVHISRPYMVFDTLQQHCNNTAILYNTFRISLTLSTWLFPLRGMSLRCNNTATRCNTLQHTATRCNTLQHTATHYTTLHHTASHCNTLRRTRHGT